MTNNGTVHLVGAGPGDPGLITVKGLQALRNADVIVYDRLAPSELLSEARSDAELVSAGKAPGAAALTQVEINNLLINQARNGKDVCRLKGGDPFVFGRGGEEAIALSDAGVPFVIVPGVTSAIAAAAYAGIPVTHRGIASSVTFVTGSDHPSASNSGVDWRAVVNTKGTIVVLMGASRLGEIAEALIRYGRDADEPVAAIHRGTTTKQRTVTASLSTIEAEMHTAGLTAPMALVIGEVAQLRQHTAWFDALPLFGKRVLVTRARSQASRLASGLSRLGAEVVQCPVIKSVPMEDTATLDTTLMRVAEYDWMAFASPNGVNQVFARLTASGRDSRALANVKIAAVGPATVQALSAYGIVADLTPDTYTAEGLVAAFNAMDVAPKSAIVFKSDIGRETLPRGLRELGAHVTEVSAYRTVLAEDSYEIAQNEFKRGMDIVTFTSSSTVKNLVNVLDGDITSINSCVVACMGPITSATAEARGIRVDLVPEEQSIPGLISAIEAYFTAER